MVYHMHNTVTVPHRKPIPDTMMKLHLSGVQGLEISGNHHRHYSLDPSLSASFASLRLSQHMLTPCTKELDYQAKIMLN